MSDLLAHRGPDDSGTFVDVDAGIAFGFRRLAIIDPSPAGHQPIESASGRFVVMLNGEIYNYVELRDDLEREGIAHRGDSDTEVMANCIDCWGMETALGRFVGMFAIAAWDRRERRLLLARDRLGIKPLYLYRTAGTLAFASEVSALRAVPGFPAEIDLDSVAAYLRWLYVPAPRSIFRQVRKLPPGTWLELESAYEESGPKCYWSLADVAREGLAAPRRGSLEEVADELEQLLSEAVRLRLRSDVPLGALLSGGLDSTAVVATAQESAASALRTFTIAFDDEVHDESVHASRVAEHLGTEHTELRLSGADTLDLVPQLGELLDEPLADPSFVPTYCVSQLARREVTVALSGDGGDELFGGYNRYAYGAPMIRCLGTMPDSARALLAAGAGTLAHARWASVHRAVERLVPSGNAARLLPAKMAKLAHMGRQTSAGAMYRALVSASQDPESLVPQAREPEAPTLEDAAARIGSDRLLDGMQWLDQAAYLPDDLLAKVDRASMAVGLEVRVPLLDHRLVRLAWSLAPDHRIDGRVGKQVLRSLVYRKVPRSLIDRPKIGFSVPVQSWLSGPLREWAGDLLTFGSTTSVDALDGEAVEATWNRFLNGEESLAPVVWALAVFRSWELRWS